MALEIRGCPVLAGKSENRFYKRMSINQKRKASPEEIARVKKASELIKKHYGNSKTI